MKNEEEKINSRNSLIKEYDDINENIGGKENKKVYININEENDNNCINNNYNNYDNINPNENDNKNNIEIKENLISPNKIHKGKEIENEYTNNSNLTNSSTIITSLQTLSFSNSNSDIEKYSDSLISKLAMNSNSNIDSNTNLNTNNPISITDFQEDFKLIEFDKKSKILNETFELTDDPNNKNLFEEETFEKIASLLNSKFYKNLERLLEKIIKKNIIKKIRIKLIKIVICFIPSYNKIDYNNLRKLISEGLPEEIPELRSLLWKLFLNYYPNDLDEWEIFSKEKSEDYEKIKLDIIDENSKEKYKNLLYEITSDITRTRTDMNFFNKNNKINEEEGIFGDLLTRILFIFAVLHHDISYIQGMNEILGTIYYSFAKSNEINLESDLFYCFENFMLEVKDIYLQDNDNELKGINCLVKKTEEILEKYDSELFNHFKNLGIEFNFFALRWILIFFSQEFFMPETLTLWDSLIIHNDKYKFVITITVAILYKKREELLNKDFSQIMFSLQNLKNFDISIDEIILEAKNIEHIIDKGF
jgi:hypothetical protein